MNITLNGAPHEVRSTRLSDLLAELGFAHARVATAVNGDFVPVPRRDGIELSDGDRVEVVAPQQGG